MSEFDIIFENFVRGNFMCGRNDLDNTKRVVLIGKQRHKGMCRALDKPEHQSFPSKRSNLNTHLCEKGTKHAFCFISNRSHFK